MWTVMRSDLTIDQPQFHWNLLADLDQMWRFAFMVNAFRAGAIVAVLAGGVGWFMVLRRQTFAGHTLAVVSFPGAAGAALIGISATYGLFAFAVVAALVIAVVPVGATRARREESAVTGTVLAFALASGYLFVTLYGGFLSGVEALLFGTFLGITSTQVLTLAVVAGLVLAALVAIGRPLLFASIDPAVAAARGVPVRWLSIGYLVLLALTAAEVSLITGTLLVFALLVAPAAAAQQLSARPVLSLMAAVGIGLLITWAALFVGYYTAYPIGFDLTSLGFAAYLAAGAWRRGTTRGRRVIAT
jgi:zinc/manganese transport system permease protein